MDVRLCPSSPCFLAVKSYWPCTATGAGCDTSDGGAAYEPARLGCLANGIFTRHVARNTLHRMP